MAEDGGVTTPQPAANPDAHATVNDFLDYTEYFPSDLQRSLRLIKDLDSTYEEATQRVHELAVKYGTLPTIPANERPDPTALRREIAAAIDKATYCRESSYAEASRLYEVAERHTHRIKIIKTKLKALPEPPSRDPTPAPVSPRATRPAPPERPRYLKLNNSRHTANTPARGRAEKRSRVPLPGSRVRSRSSSGTETELRSNIDLTTSRKLKSLKDKTPRPPKPRVRPTGSGTNVHSSIAGISTSNALARLSPPPPDAKPGSKWAPWFQLTEYEMAVLRKKMKKNAVWTPSEAMIKKQLNDRNRGQAFYEKEKARCEATGEEFLNEEPVAATLRRSLVPQPAQPQAVQPQAVEEAPLAINTAVPTVVPEEVSTTPLGPPNEVANDDTVMAEASSAKSPKSPKNPKRESQRRQAMRDAQKLQEASKRLKQAADNIQELEFSTPNTRKKSTARSNKRKRDPSPAPAATPAAATPAAATREQSPASQDSGTKPPDPKRLRILPPLAPAPGPASSTTPQTTPVGPSPVSRTPIPLPDNIKTMSVQVPLGPAGPSTPKVAKSQSRAASRHATPALPSPIVPTPEPPKSPVLLPPSNVTAASTRPRRESVAPKASSPPPPPPPAQPAQPAKPQKSAASVPEPVLPSRPRSARGHVPTPKAQSEEPKPIEGEPSRRELRRHSIFSQASLTGPTRVSTRRKPPPKGEITVGEEGQKTVTNVKRAQGNKNKKRKRADNEPAEEIGPDEPRYCYCDDISYGSMISCDNHCDKEWFHLECVGMTESDIPARRKKWFCPDCRRRLHTDAHGNPDVPPTLPGRNRGHR
ncbi:hypothetical protein CC80DRAFT_508328 [Byssothecium circinans]|uniref:Chromatin modification-related protein n=1 Tax=Byssothecium circinans TaxID=147558 RepID=A0A6A5TII8_9PLEO|nr:hypothetical protein CC80DRAFT_508328 [Byssothecium circinans]